MLKYHDNCVNSSYEHLARIHCNEPKYNSKYKSQVDSCDIVG